MKSFTDLKPLTLEDVFEYLHDGISSFEDYPPETDRDEAYLRALLDMRRELIGMSPSDRLH
jgi:hypothetical protein